jgi:hypothetical protein
VQQSNASTSNHATRRTHSQDTTATHPSGKLLNYKRLACYEHCPGTFGYTFVLNIYLHFHSRTVHLDTIKVFYLPTDAQQSCFKRLLKFTLKQAPGEIYQVTDMASFL